ncbi:MAG TPA: gephyrin-like molybdotransferase Glp [Parafilimonas sp.]|nr:gephyrin-like molybdotransferase Glp [Parafilimonas sp.]
MKHYFINDALYSPSGEGGMKGNMGVGLISVNEAKRIVVENTVASQPVILALEEAIGLTLAENVFSKLDIPAFNQSSVDGYAFAFDDVRERLLVYGEMAAGAHENFSVSHGHAARIFTGAAIPGNADTVVMQEKTLIDDGKLIINDEMLQRGGNFRPKGSEIKAGELALGKDSYLSPAAIGFFAGIGVTHVAVYERPSISIIVTGNELQTPGNILEFGQVYESNSFMLKAALHRLHFNEVKVYRVKDDLSCLSETLDEALHSTDIVFLTGGVSVGDYDFVLRAAAECGVKTLFHKVRQRPGKPLYFGRKENKLVFGLPGNPSSVLTCFYEYVIPALELIIKQKNLIQVLHVQLARNYKKLKELTFFLKGLYDGNTAAPLDAQESYRLSSFAKANCLVRLEENVAEYREGEVVEVHLLPH